ncbi:choice-of-anchor L domain-containing protein [Phormidium pseudopriestleyi FRX01]|uniref:Choice-of-anchor L domain-containing protein n=1 Tax=Phormidium pseudopriestleyi FRX01 TaxID=1759528 RepID=A0ABS3FZP3_9CYAN|nr:choice-of-anchor L domain-containing protein [Phormidium pseudopriestleyi]MBO0351807.1 choice-of-anchor L domain-containing protein [Phormidium pseudopriestleyi FRX01]
MNLYKNFTIGAALTSVAAITLLSPSAIAFTITPTDNTQILLDALLGTTTGLSNFSIDVKGNSEAMGLFENDPFGLGAGIVLSTGRVSEIPGENTRDGGIVADLFNMPNDLSTAFLKNESTPDSVSMQISFDTDQTASKLFFQYVFGSEEFVEFGGSQYNDTFELLLNGTNLAKLSDGQAVTINNLVPKPTGPFHPDYINNPAGPSTLTKLDGFTRMLTFEGLLLQNARNTLTINIQDVGDDQLDSAVFLKGKSFGTALAPDPEKVPEPGLAIASLVVGGLILRKGRKSSNRSRD